VIGREREAVLAMVAATLLWGATFVVIRDVLSALPPLALVFLRFTAAALVMLLLLALLRRRWPGGDAVKGGILAGVLAAAGFLFQAIGLTATSAGSSAFLTSTGTLLAGVFAWPLLGQRPGAVLALGLALATAGSALLPARGEWAVGPGELWTLLGAVAFGLQVVAIARFAPAAEPLAMATVQAITVALVMAPFAGGAWSRLGTLDRSAWWRLAYLALAGSLVAPLLQIKAQQALSPGRVGLLFALEPLFALAFAITVGGERFARRWWAGAALILLAVAMVERHAARSEAGSRPASG
jgi:drug/metabolite transporter (DMT)-like permease